MAPDLLGKLVAPLEKLERKAKKKQGNVLKKASKVVRKGKR